ncbi:PfkB family carbohydrate kinase [Spiroplasma endosymbiont of Aspidapion aeneum]|uniref:PfkB family carbohydrate kinase n=1 Tax=Spiroplasma endosymbiont of Aspidapion aeneum TaxID=3066276 RepID=UPI00313CD7CA
MKIAIYGEMLMRLSTKKNQIFREGELVSMNFGGAEYNVACNLGNWENNVSFYTLCGKDYLTTKCLNHLRSYNVDISSVKYIESPNPLGLYFLEDGTGYKIPDVVYNRVNSVYATNEISNEMLNTICNNNDFLYISGIAFAPSTITRNSSSKLIKKFYNIRKNVILDFNYRAKLWDYKTAKKLYEEILPFISYASLGLKDLQFILGIYKYDEKITFEENILEGFKLLFKKYPNIKSVYFTKRDFIENNGQKIQAYFINSDLMMYKSESYMLSNIIDRIGTGDIFSAGIVDGILNNKDPKEFIEFAMKGNILKHFFFGDNAKICKSKINGLKNNFDVSR